MVYSRRHRAVYQRKKHKALLAIKALRTCIRGSQTRPPGPPAAPLVGNILAIPAKAAWIKLQLYKRDYGDLVFFHGLGNSVLVLNTMDAIADLLEQRAEVYSDRPAFTVVGELMGLGQSMPLLPYNAEWKTQRKLAHNALSPRAIREYHSIQESIAALLSVQLLQDPEQFFSHVRLASSRLILSITYGLSVEEAEDEYITHAENTMRMISDATVPGAFLCDLVPILKYLPSWVPFQRHAARGKEMIERLVSRPMDHVKSQMRSGSAVPSLARHLLSSELPGAPPNEHSIKWSTGSLYGAGAETTYATVLTCIALMALHPDTLVAAQAEIDRVVGTGRLPLISDRAHLPYVGALIQEVMRWHPALPLSIARCAAREDSYRGYDIPKGTIVVPNVWAIAMDETVYHDPLSFIPERFLDQSDSEVMDPTIWAFGFGRRVCPGKHLAENSVFIQIATLLAMFDFSPPSKGKLELNFSEGLVSYPQPFECRITPRSASKASQITFSAAQSVV
ncbi:cytochrome P450 [Phanerochaete sordida]|uniref:Cytochrome P450 n=1 Tax=Phanerochaete sordida TaxID=48140 RepID=A0A9P3LDN0_9APHY|nr:cytochrome P450 [Phanerochaete sordida]